MVGKMSTVDMATAGEEWRVLHSNLYCQVLTVNCVLSSYVLVHIQWTIENFCVNNNNTNLVHLKVPRSNLLYYSYCIMYFLIYISLPAISTSTSQYHRICNINVYKPSE